MNKKIQKSVYVFISLAVLILLSGCDKRKKTEDQVEKARIKGERSVTVINNTESRLIKQCLLSTDSGVMIKHLDNLEEDNILFNNFDDKNAYENQEEFKITLIDRFDLKYEVIFSANKTGNTEVEVKETDLVKQKGNLKKKMERKLNNK